MAARQSGIALAGTLAASHDSADLGMMWNRDNFLHASGLKPPPLPP
ncbi:MAG: hypothetical protein KF712_04665 [Akkermansiaceae bacterium]|nr:hypothetical protein [Akkermansiaceae bacterium]